MREGELCEGEPDPSFSQAHRSSKLPYRFSFIGLVAICILTGLFAVLRGEKGSILGALLRVIGPRLYARSRRH